MYNVNEPVVSTGQSENYNINPTSSVTSESTEDLLLDGAYDEALSEVLTADLGPAEDKLRYCDTSGR